MTSSARPTDSILVATVSAPALSSTDMEMSSLNRATATMQATVPATHSAKNAEAAHQPRHDAHASCGHTSNDSDFEFVEAIYRDKDIPQEHRGNAFVEALPPIPDNATLARALTYLPAFSSEERKLPAAMRIQHAAKVSRIFVALPRVVDIARAMLCMLHQGYEDRAPGSASDREIRRNLYAQQQGGDFACTRVLRGRRQLSLSLSGSSGSGKTFTIENLIAKLPPVIYHRVHGRWQVPFAHIEMSHDGKSAHALATQLAEEFDRLMPDAGFVDTFMRKGRNAEERLFQVLRAAYEHGLGMLIVDEAQNQRSLAGDEPGQQRKRARSTAAANETPLMKLLITAANRARVPLMFVGTTEFAGAVGTRFTKARRSSGNGSALWAPLKRSREGQTGQFEVLLRVLFRYQWTQQLIEFSEEWADTFFEFSQGIPDILVKLWKSVQVRAIGASELVTKELVAETFEAEFKNVQFGLTALKNRDRLKLDIVSDLWSDGLDVEDYTTLEFDSPLRAVPIGTPLPAVASSETDGHAEANLTTPSTAAPSSAKKSASKAKPRQEPPSPKAAKVDAETVAAADLRGIALKDLGTLATAKVAMAKFDQAPEAPQMPRAA